MEQGRVVSLQVCKGHRQPMTPVQEVVAISDRGLEGDNHAIKGSPTPGAGDGQRDIGLL